MATKTSRKEARDLIEQLESRVPSGPRILPDELNSAADYLRRHDFSPASDYFQRLGIIQNRLHQRPATTTLDGRRNYGGAVGECWYQVRSAFDHVIISTCYSGQFNCRRGRIKMSHRFNAEGRFDFVELKYLEALDRRFDGQYRKLLLVKNFQHIRRDWLEAEAFTLPILPQELVFLFSDVFRCERAELLSWFVNLGHHLSSELAAGAAASVSENSRSESQQLPLSTLPEDAVAWPILQKASALQTHVELISPSLVLARCVRHSTSTHE